MKYRLRVAALLGSLIVAMAAIGAASAAPLDAGKGNQKHDETIAYWTPDRIANAKPREVNPTGQPDFVVPQKPGNGGGGNGGGGKPGGGTSSGVDGAPWTGGGLVQKTTGKVLFTMPDGDYVCSGSVVEDGRTGESLVLTAGHCVYDDAADVFATNWMFMPAFEDAPSTYNGGFNCLILTYGCWTAESLVTTTAFADGDLNDDYAFAVMGLGGLDGVTLLEDAVGSHGIAFNLSNPTNVHGFGYPHSAPYDGSDLTYCSGTTVADGWGGSTDNGLKCDMTGGSSGGPWFVNFDPATGDGDLNSVNSFKYLRGKYSSYMFGPYFDGYTQRTYVAAQSASGNVLVD